MSLGFIQHDLHRELVQQELATALEQGALAALLCGSVARGTATPGSDLDMRLYWREPRPFQASWHSGLLIERHGHTFERAATQIECGGPHLHAWKEAQILHDPEGKLLRLQQRAVLALARYRTPASEKHAVLHWLKSTLLKLNLATDDLYIAFLIQTTTWKLAEGICAVNNCPVPPSTLMWELLPGLPKQPKDWLESVLTGGPEIRLSAFRQVCSWVVRMLEVPDV